MDACLATKKVVPHLLAVLFNDFAIHDLLEFNPEAGQRLAILGFQPYSCLALTGRKDVEVCIAGMIENLLLKVE